MAPLPTPIRAGLGLLGTALDAIQELVEHAPEIPMEAVGNSMQLSMRVQQQYTALLTRGDEFIASLRGAPDEPPSWATFDDTPPTGMAEADDTPPTGMAGADDAVADDVADAKIQDEPRNAGQGDPLLAAALRGRKASPAKSAAKKAPAKRVPAKGAAPGEDATITVNVDRSRNVPRAGKAPANKAAAAKKAAASRAAPADVTGAAAAANLDYAAPLPSPTATPAARRGPAAKAGRRPNRPGPSNAATVGVGRTERAAADDVRTTTPAPVPEPGAGLATGDLSARPSSAFDLVETPPEFAREEMRSGDVTSGGDVGDGTARPPSDPR